MGLRARYLTTGHLLIARADGTLVAVPFDQDKLATTGAAVPVITGVATHAGYVVDYDVSNAGTLVYLAGVPRDVKETVRPVWVTREGVASPVDSGWTFDRPFNGGMSLSPDGRRLAVAIAGDPTSDIWIKQLRSWPALPAHIRGVPQVPADLEPGRPERPVHCRPGEQRRVALPEACRRQRGG